MQFETSKPERIFFRALMGACAFAMLAAIGVYAYLGTFSRYLSDDYCEAVRVNKSNPVSAVFSRYSDGSWRAANRYSNLMFVGFGELLGKNNMQIVTVLMIVLWAIGLTWSMHEFRRLLKINWSFATDAFLGLALAVFILVQSPNLFQTIYWRSSMMTHFAPLVFGSFLFAFWMKQARKSLTGKIPLPVYLLIFFATYVIAGFSEPPVTTMVTALALLIGAVWLWAPTPVKHALLPLLVWAFAGAFLGLLTMVFSPANLNMVQDSPPMIEVLKDSFLFSYIFVVYAFKVLPVPNLISAFIPALLFWFYQQGAASPLSNERKRILWTMLLAAPGVMWILIAAGFSPSVYGQGYPVERMRFLAGALMTATFMLEGAVIGLLFGNIRRTSGQVALQWAVVILFALTGFLYPLRAALRLYQTAAPEYQARARMWDLRNAYILRHAGMGETDIVVPGYSAVHNIKELDDNPKHWVNTCAANFYGIHSIRSVTFPDEIIMEYLSE